MGLDTSFTTAHQFVLILDFGSQYTHLIARRLREIGVYCELHSYDLSLTEIESFKPVGIILSGGPASVYESDAPHVDERLFSLGIPILGICYGFQEMTQALGGQVSAGTEKEFGHADVTLSLTSRSVLFSQVPDTMSVWMSHGDKITKLPKGFFSLASTRSTELAVAGDETRQLYGLQFHPEVTHTEHGITILRNFLVSICGCTCDWSMRNYLDEAVTAIRNTVGENGIVVGAVSGGVDSTVAASLMKEAIGTRFHAFLIDNGLLRRNEAASVTSRLREKCGVSIKLVDAVNEFLDKLRGVSDPEQKRKTIGHTFIECFEREAQKLDADFLLQGTLYPDVIESVSYKGPSATIKTHHNVGGLPEKMRLKLIEPLRLLFKDEVRQLGLELGIEKDSVFRHPFPGPGLAIRIIGEITDQRLRLLRLADDIFLDELRSAGLYFDIGQAFAVLLPVKAVGVMGDKRTYEEVIALRAVKTNDYMTADWYDIPTPLLRRVSSRIVNEVSGINRVTYDITSKPPGTIEWE